MGDFSKHMRPRRRRTEVAGVRRIRHTHTQHTHTALGVLGHTQSRVLNANNTNNNNKHTRRKQ